MSKRSWKLTSLGSKGNNYIIRKNEVLIGRSENCDLIIDDVYCSTMHAVMIINDDDVRIIDLTSTNGTKVNGELIKEVSLSLDDEIEIGPYKYRLDEREHENIEVVDVAKLDDKTRVFNLDEVGFSPSQEVKPEKKRRPHFDRLTTHDETGEFVDLDVTKMINLENTFDQSEYIFENKKLVKPILSPPVHEKSIEVVILADESILGINYLPVVDTEYLGVGEDTDEINIVQIDSLPVDSCVDFIEVKNGEVSVRALDDHQGFHIKAGRKHRIKEEHKMVQLKQGDTSL